MISIISIKENTILPKEFVHQELDEQEQKHDQWEQSQVLFPNFSKEPKINKAKGEMKEIIKIRT